MKKKKAAPPADGCSGDGKQSKGRDASGRFAPGNPYRLKPGQSGNPGGRPKELLSEAYRERLAANLASPKLRKIYEDTTGEKLGDDEEVNWAKFVAARTAFRAAISSRGARDAKEIREATEGPRAQDERQFSFLISLAGLPRTNAVTGKAPAQEGAADGELDGERGQAQRRTDKEG